MSVKFSFTAPVFVKKLKLCGSNSGKWVFVTVPPEESVIWFDLLVHLFLNNSNKFKKLTNV